MGAPPDVRRATSPYGRAMTTVIPSTDAELKARHRRMWASGDYPSMVETFLTPLGPRLAGTGNRLDPGPPPRPPRPRHGPHARAARRRPPARDRRRRRARMAARRR